MTQPKSKSSEIKDVPNKTFKRTNKYGHTRTPSSMNFVSVFPFILDFSQQIGNEHQSQVHELLKGSNLDGTKIKEEKK